MAETARSLTTPPRRFRFGLRSLFVVVVIVAIPLGWWAHSARRQRAAVNFLRPRGAEVQVDAAKLAVWPKWLVRVLDIHYFTDVVMVELYGDATSLDFARLCELPSVRTLYLHQTSISDDELSRLVRLPQLQRLYLMDTPITDIGLDHLSTLTSLTTLDLRGTKVTDIGVDKLRRSLPRCTVILTDADEIEAESKTP